MSDISSLQSLDVPRGVTTICRVLREQNHRAWIVGGCVRDVLLGQHFPEMARQVGDWDLCTDAEPKVVSRLFKKVIATGIAHGTVTVILAGVHFEVTTLRGEKGHSDGRRPDEVFFVDDLEQDLARRDFTVNAMAFDVLSKEFFDPFSGLPDLLAKRLRAVGEPARRFSEDGLRVLRLARFCSTLGFEVEEATRAAIRPSLSVFERVAQERVRDEWFKALESAKPSAFLRVIKEEGMLAITAPFLAEDTALLDQERLERLDLAPKDAIARLALLLAKGGVISTQEGASYLQQRLRLSKQEGARLMRLSTHLVPPQALLEEPTPVEVRRFLASIGREHLDEVLRLQALSIDSPQLSALHDALREEDSHRNALCLAELEVKGGDLVDEGIVPKGPLVGRMLAALLDRVLMDPSLNQRRLLLSLAQELKDVT